MGQEGAIILRYWVGTREQQPVVVSSFHSSLPQLGRDLLHLLKCGSAAFQVKPRSWFLGYPGARVGDMYMSMWRYTRGIMVDMACMVYVMGTRGGVHECRWVTFLLPGCIQSVLGCTPRAWVRFPAK